MHYEKGVGVRTSDTINCSSVQLFCLFYWSFSLLWLHLLVGAFFIFQSHVPNIDSISFQIMFDEGLLSPAVPLGGTAGANLYPSLSLYVVYPVICDLWFTRDLHDLPAAMIHGSTPTLEFSGRMLMSQSSWEGVSFSPGCETQAAHVWGWGFVLKGQGHEKANPKICLFFIIHLYPSRIQCLTIF